MNIPGNQTKILSFPKKRSVGVLYCAPIEQPEEWQLLTQVRGLIVMPENEPIRWELLDEARGNITVPIATKLKLKISSDAESIAALEELAPDDLHELDLGHSAVVDHSLIYIEHLTGLHSLELTSTGIGDHGISFVQNLKNLHSIGLSYSRVTNDGLTHLKALRDLRAIWLSGTQIDDLGLELISSLELLVQLGLSSTLVSDAGLLNLAKLKKLLRVYLFNTRITHNGTQLLKKLLPDCRVKWHPPQIHARDTESAGLGDDEEYEENNNENVLAAASQFGEPDFWRIIELLAWQKEGDDQAVVAPAVEALAKLPLEDILQFAEMLFHKLYLIDGADYASEIGSDAYTGSKGDFAKNWFLYVRCCVIANGRDYYSSVLKDPKLMPKDTEFRALLTIAPQSYKAKTGKRFGYTSQYHYETFSNKQLWAGK